MAKCVCELRRWHHNVLAAAEAHNPALAEGFRKVYADERETARVHRIILNPRVTNRHGEITEAQRRTLIVVATVLSRLAPHLAAVQRKKPGRLKGQGACDDDNALDKMRRLVTEKSVSVWAAAQASVEKADQRNPVADTIARRIDKKYRKLYPN